jgi:hypothetical protein
MVGVRVSCVCFRYELAYKDLTQPRICRCTTSLKRVVSPQRLNDSFSITCAGRRYEEALVFNITDTPGFFLGSWSNIPGVDRIVFPDTVSAWVGA